MATVSPVNRSAVLVPAIVGGVLGGIVIDLFLIVVAHQPIPGLWQFVASTLVGPQAFSSPSWAVLGLVLHFVTSIFWAIVYVYVWRNLSSWIVGGLVLGVVVAVCMSLFLMVKAAAPFPTGVGLIMTLIAHWLYALPVAWYVARSVRTA